MKIGIYGGSFNPIHNGHIFIGKFIIDYLNLDKLIVVPVGIPSHKNNDLVSSRLRIEMCRKAFENIEKVEISDIEIKDNKVSYTYDTLLKIRELYPGNEYFEIVGEDSGENFKNWKNYKDILTFAKVVVLKRKGYKTEIEDKNLIEIESPYINISSTEIRDLVKENKSIEKLVPKKVKELIYEKGLYKKDKF